MWPPECGERESVMSLSTLRSIAALATIILVASTAAAQLSPEHASWADGPEGFLLTKKERREWQELRSDADAKAFIELFWARRNPDPTAGFNTFRAEFQTKVRYADEHFGVPGHRGALSDRAKVLILMGRPEGVQTRGPQQTRVQPTGGVRHETRVDPRREHQHARPHVERGH